MVGVAVGLVVVVVVGGLAVVVVAVVVVVGGVVVGVGVGLVISIIRGIESFSMSSSGSSGRNSIRSILLVVGSWK